MIVIGHVKNASYHAKTKHTDVKFNFIRNQSEEVTLEYILIERTVADPLIKPLDYTLFFSHVRGMGLHRWLCRCTILIVKFYDTSPSIYIFWMVQYFWMVGNQ